MFIYNNLDNKIKRIFLIKCAWLIFLVLSYIYYIIILSIRDVIDHFCWTLLPVIIFNSLSLAFTVLDIGIMVKDNTRETNAFIPDMMYGGFSFMIPICYYISIGYGKCKFIPYEFIIILIYTIAYTIIIMWIIIIFIIKSFHLVTKTIQAVKARDITTNPSDSKISDNKYETIPIEE